MNRKTDEVQTFLTRTFNGIELEPALFYAWEPGIRFEISDPHQSYNEPGHLDRAFKRSTALFDAVFDEEDDILFVTDVNVPRDNLFLHKKPLNVYRKYIKQSQALHNLHLKNMQLPEFDEGDITTYRFSYTCRKGDIRFPKLLQAICYEDFEHPSRILKNQQSGSDIYFINLSKKLIYHLYDDRGCDIIAADKEDIRFLYERYNDWILDYDREKIDAVFK
ncbi:DUF3885 domain-containing protein [Planococcus sp. CAU13]|uniref:DUF3885 domain-containing protein n=1 Tax=Planococcus sp. CAU13 TaxID=1541197 RepID=UPI0005300116|nr:DUF3885 domain-containing protein [Planococcus sp. CAU13]